MSVVNNARFSNSEPNKLLSMMLNVLDSNYEIIHNSFTSQENIHTYKLLLKRRSNDFSCNINILLPKDQKIDLSDISENDKESTPNGKIIISNQFKQLKKYIKEDDLIETLPTNFTAEGFDLAIRFLVYRLECEKDKNTLSRKYSSLLNGLDDVIFSLDVDTLKPLYINDTAERLLSTPLGTLYNDETIWYKFVHPDDISLFKNSKAILAEKGRFEIKFRFFDKNQNIRWAESRVKLMKSGSGKRYEGLVTEITHKKIAEDKLWSTQLRLSIILKYLPNVVIYETGAGHEYISDNLYQLLGYTPQEFLKDRNSFRKIIHPEDEITAEQKIREWHNKKNTEILKIEFRARHKKGYYIWLEDYLVKVRTPKSKSFMAGILVDITQRKQYESELLGYKEMLEKKVQERTKNLELANKKLHKEIKIRIETEDRLIKSEALYRLLSSNIPNSAVCLLDADLRIHIAEGKEWGKMKLKTQKIEGKKVSEITTKDQYLYLEPGIKALLQKKSFRLESKYLEEYYLMNFIPLEITEPKSLIGIVMIHNISDIQKTQIALKERAEELMRSNADLEQFAYVTSHDLKEPLRMIGSYVQIVNKRYIGKLDDDANEFFNYITEAVHRLHTLLDDLLKFSRISKPVDLRTNFDLNELFHLACKNLEVKINETNAKIKLMDKLPKLNVDRSLIILLFQNLIDNAIKFSAGKSVQVSIYAKKNQDNWIFCVKDNGIGIDKLYFEKIFYIFQRLHSRYDYNGTGIGLAICKKILERHDGKIWVESEKGKGSSFYFSLPEKTF